MKIRNKKNKKCKIYCKKNKREWKNYRKKMKNKNNNNRLFKIN